MSIWREVGVRGIIFILYQQISHHRLELYVIFSLNF